ncbi:hypothetical protein CTAM01_04971 [Colletotrichum tamarilloi]|uniref:Uncharacterized protein n=1 Tax=Colletotrichum tamarilloi TaxID=1209934 RepID=A0ABQ9RGA8_9PEZI|nr:uncharacterized protein CTAM01_04971 [Colletotrichum tamarilloi]KAK1502982.1 hypothetical protein CTAM01_04971 [Colletotrichum tamarilloi]
MGTKLQCQLGGHPPQCGGEAGTTVIPIHGNSCKKLQLASAADAPALSLRCLPSPFNLAWKVQSVGFLNVQRGRRTSAPMCQNQLSSIFLSRPLHSEFVSTPAGSSPFDLLGTLSRLKLLSNLPVDQGFPTRTLLESCISITLSPTAYLKLFPF